MLMEKPIKTQNKEELVTDASGDTNKLRENPETNHEIWKKYLILDS